MIIGSNIIYSENLSSTNNHAAALLRETKVREGTIIRTDFQTAGRGQMGNTWESEKGKNLLISIILYPAFLKPDEQFSLSKVISLGICDFLIEFVPEVFIKWPNDIYVKDDKIAGILIENSIIGFEIENTVAGIGLNINQVIFKGGAPNPTSLKKLTGKDYDLSECLTALSSSLDKRYKQLLGGNGSDIDKDYISALYRYNRWCSFRNRSGIFEAKISGISEAGNLLLTDHKGVSSEYGFKEVEFL